MKLEELTPELAKFIETEFLGYLVEHGIVEMSQEQMDISNALYSFYASHWWLRHDPEQAMHHTVIVQELRPVLLKFLDGIDLNCLLSIFPQAASSTKVLEGN